jgi:hypothetical protein
MAVLRMLKDIVWLLGCVVRMSGSYGRPSPSNIDLETRGVSVIRREGMPRAGVREAAWWQ